MAELEKGFDPEGRRLCPDGACIGVLGPDGRCKECGKQGPQDPYGRPVAPEEARPDAAHEGARDDELADETDDEAAEDPDWDARELCPDGACTGVMGQDGRCKECGTPRSSA